ncbi:MAG: hypothetical protein ABSC05_02040 [Candidatus Solibacter sp.]|jgi:hypothetical protein
MLRAALFLLAVTPLCGQTAESMLALLNGVGWEAPPTAACAARIPVQMDVYATVEWTHHCTGTSAGVIREDFFYVFGEPARIARLRVDVRPVDESPENTARLLPAMQRALTARFGEPTHEPEMMEIGFRHPRYGQPVAGDHWQGGGLHYFLHANLSAAQPMGIRRGVQLVVVTGRLFEERARDDLILRAEGFSGEAREDDDPVRARLKARIGAPYVRATMPDLTAILREADGAGAPRRAIDLVAADAVIGKLTQQLSEGPAAESLRRQLAPYGVKLGGMTHQGGLAYERDLLWRVWRESPETEGGELAFLQLQRLGWNTGSGEGCPKNPDLFRDAIDRAEAFLASHPRSDFRKEVLYTLAVAHESWWSIAHAPRDDEFVNAPPYPRRASNAQQAERARAEAIRHYREVVALAPGSPEAASALRRLPRLELGLDTGQRRFFCSYC